LSAPKDNGAFVNQERVFLDTAIEGFLFVWKVPFQLSEQNPYLMSTQKRSIVVANRRKRIIKMRHPTYIGEDMSVLDFPHFLTSIFNRNISLTTKNFRA
jgi:hypothetical protein